MTYDIKCYELAEAFLDDPEMMKDKGKVSTAHDKHVLAGAIQTTIEDYIENELEDASNQETQA